MHIDTLNFDRCHLLVVGDLMLDEYVWGDVDRISPEAPVQVVAVKNQEYTLGGSGNVVNNLIALGAQVSVLGVIGPDPDGKLLLNKLDDLGVDTRGIIQEDRRLHQRKEVLLPARWRLYEDEKLVEHDVLIRNISLGGAYTEYINGEKYRLFVNDTSLSLGLVARLPGSQEPLMLDCKPVRFHITRDYLGVGLRYTEMADAASQISLNRFLT